MNRIILESHGEFGSAYPPVLYDVLLDKIPLESQAIRLNTTSVPYDKKRYYMQVNSRQDYERLRDVTWYDLIKHFDTVEFIKPIESLPEIRDVTLGRDDERYSVVINLVPLSGEWNNPFTIFQFIDVMVSEIEMAHPRLHISDGMDFLEHPYHELYLNHEIAGFDELLGDALNSIAYAIKAAIDSVTQQLIANVTPKTLLAQFNFPLEARIACEQYLLAFVNFLRAVGIAATASVEEQANRTLFTITPTHEKEALEKIKVALEIYLNLPSSPTADRALSFHNDIESQQVEADLQNFKTQLMLANALIQQKDWLINQQSGFIQQQLQARTVLVDSMISAEPSRRLPSSSRNKPEDSEPLGTDLIRVTKYKKEFLEIDLPELLRRLKKWFHEAL